jgi:hypothetical protein
VCGSDVASIPSTTATGEASPLVNYGRILTDVSADSALKKEYVQELLGCWDEKSDVYVLALEPFVADIFEQALQYRVASSTEMATLYCQLLGKLALSGSSQLMSDIFTGMLNTFELEILPVELCILRSYYNLWSCSSVEMPLEWNTKLFSKNGVTTFLHFFLTIKSSLSATQEKMLATLLQKVTELHGLCRLLGTAVFKLAQADYLSITGLLTSVRVVLWAWSNVYVAESIPLALSISSYDQIKTLCVHPLIDDIENVFCLHGSEKK